MNLQEAKAKLAAHMEQKFYSRKTVKAYTDAIVRYAKYLQQQKPDAALEPSKRVENYLTHRVQVDDISPSTQNVELNALVLFYHVMGIELKGVNALRARKRHRIPPILTKPQVQMLIEATPHEFKLVSMLLYGCAMRINECLRLRLKDVDLTLEKLTLHETKGDKERVVHIPSNLMPLVRVQYNKAVEQWKIDVYHKFNGVNCNGIEKKYPAYAMSQDWYWLFPAASYSAEPKTHTPMMRHHVMDWTIQRIFEAIRDDKKLPAYTTPHILRHACLTHMAEDMLQRGFPEKMIKAQLKDISGHVMDETLEGYLHLAAPRNALVVSPIESLFVNTTYSNKVG